MDKKNIPVIVAFSIPLLMVLLVIAAVSLPRAFAPRPQYNFIYSIGDYNFTNVSVLGGRLIVQQTGISGHGLHAKPLRLFFYNVKNNSAREISVKEASGFVLDANLKSPDGYEIENNSPSYDLVSGIFGPHDYPAWYIAGHGTSRKVDLPGYGDLWSFRFTGWVTGQDNG